MILLFMCTADRTGNCWGPENKRPGSGESRGLCLALLGNAAPVLNVPDRGRSRSHMGDSLIRVMARQDGQEAEGCDRDVLLSSWIDSGEYT